MEGRYWCHPIKKRGPDIIVRKQGDFAWASGGQDHTALYITGWCTARNIGIELPNGPLISLVGDRLLLLLCWSTSSQDVFVQTLNVPLEDELKFNCNISFTDVIRSCFLILAGTWRLTGACESACSAHTCVGFLQVLQCPPTMQRDTRSSG